jgi:hypothetical protein
MNIAKLQDYSIYPLAESKHVEIDLNKARIERWIYNLIEDQDDILVLLWKYGINAVVALFLYEIEAMR